MKREAAGYTQRQLADKLGIRQQAYSMVERGSVSPSTPVLMGIVEILGCTADELLFGGERGQQ
jgi:transcriptional regulator with XRE-family HTH domain